MSTIEKRLTRLEALVRMLVEDVVAEVHRQETAAVEDGIRLQTRMKKIIDVAAGGGGIGGIVGDSLDVAMQGRSD